MAKSKKTVLLGAVFTSNMGVCALTSGILTSVWHTFPNSKITLLDYNSTPLNYEVKYKNGIRLVELINLRFSKTFWLPNNIARLLLTVFMVKVLKDSSLQDKIYEKNPWLKNVHQADMAGSIAGGDSFSDIYGLGRLIYVSLPQILVLLMGKPLLILPQTIGPFKTPLGRFIGRYILNRAVKVYSRDKESLKFAKALTTIETSHLKFGYDVGFILEPAIESPKIPKWLSERSHQKPLIGINVSGLLYIGGYSKNNMFGIHGNYPRLIHGLIEMFIEAYGAEIMLVPHVHSGGRRGVESDTAACEKVLSETRDAWQKKIHVLDEDFDHHELKWLIGRCNFFLGSRMHACIAALSQNVPAIGLAYSRKFRGVYETVHVEELVLDLRTHDEKTILPMTKVLFEKREVFESRLQKKIPEVKASIRSLFADEFHSSEMN